MNWISVEDKPLIIREDMYFEITANGDRDFLCYVPTNKGAFIQMCRINDETGDLLDTQYGDPQGYDVEDITHYMFIDLPPEE